MIAIAIGLWNSIFNTSAVTGAYLREDSGYILREDGGKILRQ